MGNTAEQAFSPSSGLVGAVFANDFYSAEDLFLVESGKDEAAGKVRSESGEASAGEGSEFARFFLFSEGDAQVAESKAAILRGDDIGTESDESSEVKDERKRQ